MPDSDPVFGKIIGQAPDGGFRYQPVLRGGDGQYVPFMAPLGTAYEESNGPVLMGAIVEIFGDRFTYSMKAEAEQESADAKLAEHFRSTGHSRMP